MGKGQGTIIGTVLISSIIIGIVSVSYLWGKPLIDKSTDKVRINSIISKMKNLESSIETVAKGGSQRMKISLKSNEKLKIENHKITLTTYTSVPIITALSWAPLNAYELPFRRNLYRANTSEDCDPSKGSCACNITGGTEVDISGNATYDPEVNISGTSYYVCNYNITGCAGYCYSCLNETANMTSKDCGKEDEEVGYLKFEIIGKNETYLSGNETVVPGVLGEDTPGILMGKTTPTGGKQEVKFRIRFRPLLSKKGRKFKIEPRCEKNCVAKGGDHKIKIRKEKTVKKVNSTITYITLSID